LPNTNSLLATNTNNSDDPTTSMFATILMNQRELATCQRELAEEMRSRMSGVEAKVERIEQLEEAIGALVTMVRGRRYGSTVEALGGTGPIVHQMVSRMLTSGKTASEISEEFYSLKSNNHKSNLRHVNKIIAKHPQFFKPLVERFPKYNLMLSRVLVNSFGFHAGRVDYTKRLEDWGEVDCHRAGSAVAFFLRKRKTADAGLDA